MKIKKIERGKWYQTKRGIGYVLQVGGTHPPSIQIRIDLPFPHGVVYLSPRDIQHEVADPFAEPEGK